MGFFSRFKDSLDPDRLLMEAMNGFIEAVAVRRALDYEQETWQPGKPLKLGLAGYVGTRNTGADVRVEARIRHFRRGVGDDGHERTAMSLDLKRTAGSFRSVRQCKLPVV